MHAKTRLKAGMLALLCGAMVGAAPQVGAFCSTEVSNGPFDIWGPCEAGTPGHEDITTAGLSFLNPGALNEINNEHAYMDGDPLSGEPGKYVEAPLHFDNCRLQEAAEYINNQYLDGKFLGAGGVIAEFDPEDPSPLDAADEFGQLLHTVQDFYSHSNWIELNRTDLYEGGLGEWAVPADWSVLRDDIVITSENLPPGWSATPGTNFVPKITTNKKIPLRGLYTGIAGGTDDDCLDSIAVHHDDDGQIPGLSKDRDLPTEPLWADAFNLATQQTAHEWCRLLHLLQDEYGVAGPATAMGLWLANTGSPHPEGTACAPRSAGPVKVTVTASSVEALEDMDDGAGELNLRLMLFTEDLRRSARSQSPPITGVHGPQMVTPPASVSLCVEPTDSLGISLQGWDDDDEVDGSPGIPGEFDDGGDSDDDALAGASVDVGVASAAAGTYTKASDDLDVTFVVTVSTADDGSCDSALPPGATDLELDPAHFYVNYQANNMSSPNIQMPPTTTGTFPFNTADTPFLLPCDVQNFAGQLQAHLVSAAAPVYWQTTGRFIHEEGFAIVGHGYSGTQNFDHLNAAVTPILNLGASADMGYTPFSTVNTFRDWLYQPTDLGANSPVRMELSVTPFADAQHTQPIVDSNPANNVVNLWVMRECGA